MVPLSALSLSHILSFLHTVTQPAQFSSKVRVLQEYDPTRSATIVNQLHEWLYNEGPEYSNRARRSEVEIQVGC